MRIQCTKTKQAAHLDITRSDGSSDRWETSMASGVPHDLVHWVVEEHFDLRSSFYGHIASGLDQYLVNELARPDTELAQTEKLVLLLQTELDVRSGRLHASPTHLRGLYGLRYPSYCDDEDIDRICDKIGTYASRWEEMAVGDGLTFEYRESDP